ncbi:hypothetical protein NMY22_g15484 [Coprinellus aureogranulatus]|nr:hypothetical protein NMY22_g15484 [Coprinellus aureogranulatus]
MDECPDEPVLDYYDQVDVLQCDVEHIFVVLSGVIDTTSPDKSTSLFEQPLVEDRLPDSENPTEVMPDVTSTPVLSIPFNQWAKRSWHIPKVKGELLLPGFREIVSTNGNMVVKTKIYGTSTRQMLFAGHRHRLLRRLTELNAAKIPSSLFDFPAMTHAAIFACETRLALERSGAHRRFRPC